MFSGGQPVDRRYTQSRFYNGTRAAGGTNARSRLFADRALAVARANSYQAQRYGGSTGGLQSIGSGQQVSMDRAIDRADRGKIFEDFGAGELGAKKFGARAEMAEVRGFRDGTGTSVDLFA